MKQPVKQDSTPQSTLHNSTHTEGDKDKQIVSSGNISDKKESVKDDIMGGIIQGRGR